MQPGSSGSYSIPVALKWLNQWLAGIDQPRIHDAATTSGGSWLSLVLMILSVKLNESARLIAYTYGYTCFACARDRTMMNAAGKTALCTSSIQWQVRPPHLEHSHISLHVRLYQVSGVKTSDSPLAGPLISPALDTAALPRSGGAPSLPATFSSANRAQ